MRLGSYDLMALYKSVYYYYYYTSTENFLLLQCRVDDTSPERAVAGFSPG